MNIKNNNYVNSSNQLIEIINNFKINNIKIPKFNIKNKNI